MSQYYEIVIFTAALSEYANWIIDKIDSKNLIKHKLYRQHTVPQGNTYIKVNIKFNDYQIKLYYILLGSITYWQRSEQDYYSR